MLKGLETGSVLLDRHQPTRELLVPPVEESVPDVRAAFLVAAVPYSRLSFTYSGTGWSGKKWRRRKQRTSSCQILFKQGNRMFSDCSECQETETSQLNFDREMFMEKPWTGHSFQDHTEVLRWHQARRGLGKPFSWKTRPSSGKRSQKCNVS